MSTTPQDYEILDFEIVEESWNEYELADGNRIKGRIIITRVFQIFDKNKQNQETSYLAEKQKFFVTFAPSSNRHTPNMPKELDLEKAAKVPVKVISNNEKWSIYRIAKNGEILKAKLIVDEVHKIDGIYDNYGLPLYQINSAELVMPSKNTKSYAQ